MNKTYIVAVVMSFGIGIAIFINNNDTQNTDVIQQTTNNIVEQNKSIASMNNTASKDIVQPMIISNTKDKEQNTTSTIDSNYILITTINSEDQKYKIDLYSDGSYQDNIMDFGGILIEGNIANSMFFVNIDKSIYSYKENKLFLYIEEIETKKIVKILFDIKSLIDNMMYAMNVNFDGGYMSIQEKADIGKMKKDLEAIGVNINQFKDPMMKVEDLNKKVEEDNKMFKDINNTLKVQ